MRIAYVAHCFPILTETFTYREVEALRREGLDVVVFSAKRPDLGVLDERARSFVDNTIYLPSVFSRTTIMAECLTISGKPFLNARLALNCVRANPQVDRTWHRLRPMAEFLRGVYFARLLTKLGTFDHLHAQFAMGASTTVWVASRLTGLPFSFTSHSSHYQPLLCEKVRDAAFIVSTSEYDKHRLLRLTNLKHAEHIVVIPGGIGIDTGEWVCSQKPDDGSILSVGQLGEQKGHPFLMGASVILRDRGYQVLCNIAGGGPMRQELESLISAQDLQSTVRLLGPMPNAMVKDLCRRCQVFVLACVKANNGATDGVPFALMEAMAMGKPCISTSVAGIPELIQDGVSGLLVPERDSLALANAIEQLLTDEDLRRRLGENARRRVEQGFDERKNARKLAALFRNKGPCSQRSLLA